MTKLTIYQDKINIDGMEITIGRNAIVLVKEYSVNINSMNKFINLLERNLDFTDIAYEVFGKEIPILLLNCLIHLSTNIFPNKMTSYIDDKAKTCFKDNAINHRSFKKFLKINSQPMLAPLLKNKRDYTYPFKELIYNICNKYQKILSLNLELKNSSAIFNGKEFFLAFGTINNFRKVNLTHNKLINFMELLEKDNIIKLPEIIKIVFGDKVGESVSISAIMHLITLIKPKLIYKYINISAEKCFESQKPSLPNLKRYLNLPQLIYINKNENGKKSFTFYLNEIIQDIFKKFENIYSEKTKLLITIKENKTEPILRKLTFYNIPLKSWQVYINLLTNYNLNLTEIMEQAFSKKNISSDLKSDIATLTIEYKKNILKKYLLGYKKRNYQFKNLLVDELLVCPNKLIDFINKQINQCKDLIINRDSIVIFNSKINISNQNRLLLEKISFNIEKFKHFHLLIQEKNLNLDEITRIVLNTNNTDEKTISILIILYSNIHKKEFHNYILKKAIICFRDNCIDHQVLKKYVGLNDAEILRNNIRSNTKDYHKKILLDEIRSVCLFFKNNNIIKNKIYKNYPNQFILYYNGIESIINISKSPNSSKNNRIFTHQPKLIFYILSEIRNNNSINKILEETSIEHSILNKLTIDYYPKYFIKIIEKEMKLKIINNGKTDLSIRGNNSFTKTTKIYGKTFKENYEIVLDRMRNIQKRIFKKINIKNLEDKSLRNFNIGFISKGIFCAYNFNIHFKKNPLYLEYLTYFKHKEISSSNMTKLKKLSTVLNELTINNEKIISAKDITLDMVLEYLENNDELLSRTHLSSFFTFLMDYNKIDELQVLPIPPKENIFLKIVNKREKHNNHKVIPENIYAKIHKHIDDLPIDIKNAFLICSATACRFGELEYMYDNSLKYSENKKSYILSFFISKTKKSAFKKGKDSFRHVPIKDLEIINAYKEQGLLTKDLRKKSKLESIFIYKTINKGIKVYDENTYSSKINALIKKHNITDEKNCLWHFTSHQVRATIPTRLAESGYTSGEIMEFMGWVDKSTMEEAYINLEKNRLKDLNSKFFFENFRAEISDNVLKSFTKKDKEKLFIGLYVNFRQMEYGKCVRHPILGECGKLQEPKSCASCSKLITSKDFLPKWEKLRDSQINIINQLKINFEKENISKEEYETWAEYKREIFILSSYNSLIERIN